MFDAFYEFKATPFSRTIDTDALYKVDDTDEIIERLIYTAKRQLFAVFTGESGIGKTTTLRRFVHEMKDSAYIFLYLSDSCVTPKSFYKTILEQLGIESKFTRGDAKRQLHKQVEILKAVNNISPVAIVDEAHLLSREMLEEIRFLLNYKMDSVSPMALILTGQSELWDKLKLQSYAAVRGRIDIVCHIGCLERSQVEDYIRAHLAYAGCEKTIFTDGAIEEIFKFSGGIPRLVNKACTSSLIYGAQNKKNIIEERTVKLIIEQELN